MHINANKENSKDYYNTDISQTDCIVPSVKTKLAATFALDTHSQGAFAQQLALKVYQQRIKNQQLYQQIKKKFQFFDYELRSPLKSIESESVLIKQYDRLLQERDNLEKERTKHEYHYQRIAKQNDHNYNFLVDPWKHQKHRTTQSNQDRIDRMNKMIVIMKQGINSCMNKQYGLPQKIIKDLQQSKRQYTTVSESSNKIQEEVKRITIEFNQKIAQKQAQIAQISKQNQQLVQIVNKLQQQQNNSRQNQVELYQKLNKLSEKLLEKERKIQELKISRETSRKYISKEIDSSNCPLFQIIIKSAVKVDREEKYQSIIIDKKLEEVQEFLSKTSQEYRNSFHVFRSANKVIQDGNHEIFQKDSIGEMSPSPCIEDENVRDYKYYSSNKKTRRSRELLSGLKPREISQGMQQLKQMLFIRRK